MKRCSIIITGFGSVGYRVAEQLEKRVEHYRNQYQRDVRVIAVCGSKTGLFDAEGLPWGRLESLSKENGGVRAASDASLLHTGTAFLASADFDVLIEAGPTDFITGGAAYSYIQTALLRGKHAISISKGALVKDYPGLRKLSSEQGGMLKISGATAAALPTIDLVEYNLAGCEVQEISGIFTGTANFILTGMMDEGVSFAEALAEAQRKGIAEPDPSFDLEGWDTACKLTILANAAFQADTKLDDVKREGIASVTAEQAAAWRADGLVPKLIGRISRNEDRTAVEVKLKLYQNDHPFAQVKGTTKAIQVKTDLMGELLVIGGKSDPRAAAAAALKDLEHVLAFTRNVE